MRISKEPEVRKQEIIDTAMSVFAEKGYEATTMKDIAQRMNVASGLCYHYFQNKQILYETAAAQYAKACSRIFTDIFKRTELPVEQCLAELGDAWKKAERDGTYKYADFYHGKGNKPFHRQMDVAMVEEVLPYVTAYLQVLVDRKEAHITNIPATAGFLLNGQLAILNDQRIPLDERFELARELILKVLR